MTVCILAHLDDVSSSVTFFNSDAVTSGREDWLIVVDVLDANSDLSSG